MPPTSSLKFPASVLLMAGFCQFAAAAEPPEEPMNLWFSSPASSYLESCPLGNGRLGAMDFGGVDECRVVLNESSVWSGGPYDANRPDAHQSLEATRKAIFSGDIETASNLLSAHFKYADGIKGWWDDSQFGCYQILGDLTLRFKASIDHPVVTSPSGHARGDSVSATVETRYDGVAATPTAPSADHSIRSSVDGSVQTKWCVPNSDGSVTWKAELPAAWKDGKVTGLRARGNLTVDIAWKDGKVTHHRITSPEAREVKIKINGSIQTEHSKTP